MGSLYAGGNDLVIGDGGASNQGMTIYTGASNQGIIAFADGFTGAAQKYACYLLYDHTTDSFRVATTGQERLRIDSSGNLLASNYKSNGVLTIGYDANGNNGVNDYINFVHGVSDEKMRLDGSGRLGIGTANPTKLLHLAQNSDVAIRMHAGNANANARSWEIVVGGNASNNAEMIFRTRQDDGTGGSEIARFTTGGDLKFPSGGGIDFSATANSSGSMTSELFDDYEEGTWSPVIDYSGSNPSVTYSNREGTYTKIGRMVYVFWDMNASSISSGSGFAQISGLPYTVSNNMAGYSVVQWRDSSAIAAGGSETQLKGFAQRGNTYLYIQIDNSGSSGYGYNSSRTWNSSGRITGYAIYEA